MERGTSNNKPHDSMMTIISVSIHVTLVDSFIRLSDIGDSDLGRPVPFSDDVTSIMTPS